MLYTSHKASVSLSGVLADVSLTLGRSQCDSCWGGAGGHRHMHVSGCFCLWEGGRKQRLMPLCSTSCSLAFRRSLQPAALAPQSRAAAPRHQLTGGLSPGPGVPPPMTEAVSPKLHCHFCNNAGNAALSSSPTLPSLSCVPVRGGRLSASQVHSLCRSNWREAVSLTLQYFGNKQATAEFSFFFFSENCSFYLFFILAFI